MQFTAEDAEGAEKPLFIYREDAEGAEDHKNLPRITHIFTNFGKNS